MEANDDVYRTLVARRSEIITGEHIFWRVAKSDPLWTSLEPLLPARLLNPVVAATVSDHLGHESWGPWQVDDGDTVISTQGVLVEWDDGNDNKLLIWEMLPRLLASMRYLAGQSRLPSIIQLAGFIEFTDREIKATWPEFIIDAEVTTRSIRTAIPVVSVSNAVQTTLTGGPPAHGTFFVDAVSAYLAQDWRMALLLAAIAVDTGAAASLARWHAERLATRPFPPTVVEVSGSGGMTSIKDPVYEELCHGTSFQRMLHARPLHLVQRSLMLEDPATYQRALKLYRTRNKIVHMGAPASEDSNCYDFSRSCAAEAIECASACLAFFGYSATASLEPDGRTQVRGGTLRAR